MSHFTALVIMPKAWVVDQALNIWEQIDASVTEEKAQEIVSSLVARYDENVAVEPYETECYCVNTAAAKSASDRADAEFGTLADLRKSFVSPIPEGAKVAFDSVAEQVQVVNDAWRAHIGPRIEAERRYLHEHPDYGKGEPTCEECHGSGKRTTTYNPLSKWDWWQIGGRWQGSMTTDGRDVFQLSELQNGWKVFAIVTPDGEWHAEGDMGWWGMTSNEDDKWDRRMYELASAFPEHMGVLIDCHI